MNSEPMTLNEEEKKKKGVTAEGRKAQVSILNIGLHKYQYLVYRGSQSLFDMISLKTVWADFNDLDVGQILEFPRQMSSYFTMLNKNQKDGWEYQIREETGRCETRPLLVPSSQPSWIEDTKDPVDPM